MSQDEINKNISEIIEQGKSGKLKYLLPVGLKKVVLEFRPYIGILNKINKIIKSSTQLSAALAILNPELLEYLLEFVILFYENGCEVIFEMQSHFSPKKNSTHFIIITIFEFVYLKYIDLLKSDNHVLAYLYVTYLSNTSNFGYIVHNDHKHCFSRNPIKMKFVENYILKSDNVRHLNVLCKKSLFQIFAVIYNSDTVLPENLILSKFCSNNDGNLRIMAFTKNNLLLRIQNKESLHKKIKHEDISLVIGSYLYKTLNIFQTLFCINSSWLVSKLDSYGEPTKLLLCNRISEWVTKYTDIIDYINSDISFYWYAFLNICYFWNKNKIINPKRDLLRNIDRLFCKTNLEYILSDVCKPKINYKYLKDSFETWMKAFSIFKMIDDDFVLLLLYSKTYSKMYAHERGVGHLHVGMSFSKPIKPIWYIINDINNLHSNESGYNSSSDLHIKIHGINNSATVRQRLCIDHFSLRFGIDAHHLNLMEKTLVEKTNNGRPNRNQSYYNVSQKILTFRKLQTLHNRIKLKLNINARTYHLPMMNK